MPRLLGIDCGLTVSKAVIFDMGDRQLSVARRCITQLMLKPHHVERDMHALWQGTAEAISASGRQASDFAGVAATAHGDGISLLDKNHQPLGHDILSLDSRAAETSNRWIKSGTGARAVALTGQLPVVSFYPSLLGWLKQYEPERFARIGHVLSCKDYLRFCMTGTVATGRTEASVAFTNVSTQTYSNAALALFGLKSLHSTLRPVFESAAIVGQVAKEAASLTGLKEGTPVAAGLHDVTASAIDLLNTKHRLQLIPPKPTPNPKMARSN